MSIVHSVNEKSSQLKTATAALNHSAINAAEEILRNSLESHAFYNAILINQWRSLASIHDVESFRQCFADSVTATGAVTKRMISDSQSLLDIGARFKDGLAKRGALH